MVLHQTLVQLVPVALLDSPAGSLEELVASLEVLVGSLVAPHSHSRLVGLVDAVTDLHQEIRTASLRTYTFSNHG